jgi:hypothetical protein
VGGCDDVDGRVEFSFMKNSWINLIKIIFCEFALKDSYENPWNKPR